MSPGTCYFLTQRTSKGCQEHCFLGWLYFSCPSGLKARCQTSGNSTPPFTPFPARDYTADFLNFPPSPYPRANAFWICNFPSINSITWQVTYLASVFPKRRESSCSRAEGVQRIEVRGSVGILPQDFGKNNIADLQETDCSFCSLKIELVLRSPTLKAERSVSTGKKEQLRAVRRKGSWRRSHKRSAAAREMQGSHGSP